ncbi:hypothetical protein [Pseudomonas plecoglossicida]|uniref:hypothetical protein n=1 Tax=Pseudomonas plecoglossicida TaxID=70775 RepID=UPI0015E34BB4|nr:hypothetical protein [Pseudomonas plecoglossicida]MBA1324664.1 hypothetical protein [Pseudomonas plecoglossicida]
MSSISRKVKTQCSKGAQPFLDSALAEFEMESRMACRAMRVRLAMTVFGVGSLLPNDLPRSQPLPTTDVALGQTVH